MVLLLFLLPPCQSWAQSQVIRLTNGEFPPFLTEEKEGYGVASRIVTEAFAASGYLVNYGFFPWKRALVLAERGEWDGSVVWSWSEERAESFLYSDPVIVTREVFFHRSTRDFTWDGYESLTGYRIGATIGYFYGEEFHHAQDTGLIQVEHVATDYHNLRKLAHDRIDISLVEINVGRALLKEQLPEFRDMVVPYDEKPVRVTTLHLVVSKTLMDGEGIVSAFNKGMKQIDDTGRIEEIFRQAGLTRRMDHYE
ncbi:amino acid ABC transporter substrate-binding protein (PAAT family) [Aestuariispira insulae]|uniref:Amino acid ABC transporter substrate-binding protein (PAAT family) n=2 Tax=Aestuariispira insulae TaxID=1461337 RepID=A0A3D9HQ02_9PROT|nr:amino acid ABC transporter substrate-binding protein (PAAT family) [Aestuariispira insulae]